MRAGVRAQVAVVLFDTARARGVLNLYSHRSGAFDDTAVLTDLFAHHSATALAYAADYHDRETTVAERRAVGQALGIVMERYQLSEAKAFALLQRTAEHRAVSVRLVAQELVARAEEPAPRVTEARTVTTSLTDRSTHRGTTHAGSGELFVAYAVSLGSGCLRGRASYEGTEMTRLGLMYSRPLNLESRSGRALIGRDGPSAPLPLSHSVTG